MDPGGSNLKWNLNQPPRTEFLEVSIRTWSRSWSASVIWSSSWSSTSKYWLIPQLVVIVIVFVITKVLTVAGNTEEGNERNPTPSLGPTRDQYSGTESTDECSNFWFHAFKHDILKQPSQLLPLHWNFWRQWPQIKNLNQFRTLLFDFKNSTDEKSLNYNYKWIEKKKNLSAITRSFSFTTFQRKLHLR